MEAEVILVNTKEQKTMVIRTIDLRDLIQEVAETTPWWKVVGVKPLGEDIDHALMSELCGEGPG